jgi:carboxymethylenebutenolidase
VRFALLASFCLTLLPLCAWADDDDYADRMAAEHQHDDTSPSPAAQKAPARPISEARVAYATLDGKAVEGFLAKPEGAVQGAPAVILIHEWWGLNENIESVARQLAAEGYAALAVDLYEGAKAAKPEEARALMQAASGRAPVLLENLRQAAAYLRGQGSTRVGVVGWCFGGGWSLQAALAQPTAIDAAVIYYGRVETDPTKLAPLAAPVLGIFGALDKGIPVDGVRQFEAALKTAGKSAEIHVYENADHAFANPSGTRYQKEAAEDAWAKTLAFFAKTLKG